jgi:hypothetical protein
MTMMMINKIAIDISRAITPNLLGINRTIAYANKKYHLTIMWSRILSEVFKQSDTASPNNLLVPVPTLAPL